MATLEDLRIADWAKPENGDLAYDLRVLAAELRAAAKRGVVGADRAKRYARNLTYARNHGWPQDVKPALARYREEIHSLLRGKTPTELRAVHGLEA